MDKEKLAITFAMVGMAIVLWNVYGNTPIFFVTLAGLLIAGIGFAVMGGEIALKAKEKKSG